MVVVLLCVWWWQCGGGDLILKVRVMRTDSNYNGCNANIIDSRQIESVSTEVSKACLVDLMMDTMGVEARTIMDTTGLEARTTMDTMGVEARTIATAETGVGVTITMVGGLLTVLAFNSLLETSLSHVCMGN